MLLQPNEICVIQVGYEPPPRCLSLIREPSDVSAAAISNATMSLSCLGNREECESHSGFGVSGPVPALFNIAHNPKAKNVYPSPSLNVCRLLDAVSEIGDGAGIQKKFFFSFG